MEQEPICAKCGKPCDESNAFKNRQGQWFHNACIAEHMSSGPELGFIAKLELPWWAGKIVLCFIGLWFFTPELWDAPWTVKLVFASLAGILIHFFPNLLKRYFWYRYGWWD